ncbi:MAG: hypothetical protein RML36_00910 [Anaerolineae bacterium]|nr:hypothetical protein [Anaerolineae bacterium]MDW8098027.1 hypothetical protein [Anaerolineae bacterium]
MKETAVIHQAFEQGEGILRLAPTWVPRAFCIPGKRIKLHPDDLYAFGAHRGGIDERWLASTTKADNGPLTTPDEGLSYVIYGDEDKPQKVLLKDVVEELGPKLLGEELWNRYHRWPVYSKFFDNKGPLPHHLHQRQEHAALVGMEHKPEAYYFPLQLNNYGGDFPYTFFGLEPGTTREQVRHCLEIWNQGDNHITDLSKAYRLQPGTGWYVPAGVLHAPGSLCTYEPQWASDIFAMFQSLVSEVPIDWSLLVKNVPEDKHHDLDFLVSLIDWEANTDPSFKEKYFRPPVPVKPIEEMKGEGYIEKWVTYGNEYFAAKELTVLPRRTVTIRDAGPYGMIMLQGHGTMGVWPIETPTLIRFGQLTHDEYFISYTAAREGVTIHNPSKTDPIVMLKHFGPNPEAPQR